MYVTMMINMNIEAYKNSSENTQTAHTLLFESHVLNIEFQLPEGHIAWKCWIWKFGILNMRRPLVVTSWAGMRWEKPKDFKRILSFLWSQQFQFQVAHSLLLL